MSRMDRCANIINPFSHCHADIVSCNHVSAETEKRPVCCFNHNILRRIGVPKQAHILTGFKNQGSLGSIPAQNLNLSVFIVRMPYQKAQASVRVDIGKLRIPPDTCA